MPDITELPQLTYRSSNGNVSVADTGDAYPLSPRPVALGGGITVNTVSGSSDITVELKLTAPATNLSATGTVFPRTDWSQGGGTEVPRGGARVTPAHQLARWIDGITHLRLGRRKTVGRGEGSSGLRFDTTEPD
jgi:hypothetical protein